MAGDLSDVRKELDLYTVFVVNGLCARSKYDLGNGMSIDGLIFPDIGITKILPGIVDKIIESYRGILSEICQNNGNLDYKRIRGIDITNVVTWYRRIAIGLDVARLKLKKDSSLLHKTEPDLREALRDLDREKEVFDHALAVADGYDFNHPKTVRGVFRWLMDLTLDGEISYILSVKGENETSETSVFGELLTENRVGLGYA